FMEDNPKVIENKPKITPNITDYDKTYKDFSWDKAEKELVDFFDDGTLNIAYNCIDRHALGERKDKPALIYAGADGNKQSYSFAQMKSETDKFANVLVGQGIKKGERVFIFLPPIPERYFAFLGIFKMGAIAGTLFAAFQEIALLDRLQDSGAKVVVTSPELYPRIESIRKDLPDLEKVIIIERGETLPEGDGIISYEAEMKTASEDFQTLHMSKDDYSYMLYTSGTTGKPKGVVHAHYDVLQAMVTTKYSLDVQEDDIYWCTADLGWVTGVVYGVLGIWGLGGTSVIYDGRFSPEAWYKVLQDNKVTIWYSAPTAIRMLMGAPVSPKDFDLSALRHLCSVGEPLNPEAIWWGMDAFGLPFHDTWWQTEQGAITITNYPCLDIRPGSMGKPLPGIEAAVIDDSGKEVADGKEGDLVLKASTVSSLMKTIWGNKEKYDSYFKGEWYISGDRAVKDKDGYFWFVGRADDVINTAGERVGPFEVESALVEHPAVVEAGVIGKPDAVRGQIIKAFVVVKPGVPKHDELKNEIQAHVKKHLAGHAYPREIEFIDKLPKTRSGKIMRRILKSQELGEDIGDTSTLEDY
ncbi:MAG TPA: acetate--CoA ligase, partial [Candidatus Saccharimonadales bacterium]|nr:acetate--CoA ligase [Candidatus Saccharimonadales bacterium]